MKLSTKNIGRAIFFDRDGVLNVDRGYVYRPADFIWVDRARETIKLANDLGFKVFVVTNQSGIARGFYTLNDMNALHDWMQQELVSVGAKIDQFYYCPYHEVGDINAYVIANHPDRKPNPGMILRAINDYHIEPKDSLLIGDKSSDMEAAERAGVDAVLFKGGDLYKTLEDWLLKRGII